MSQFYALEERVSRQASEWLPSATGNADVTIEADELYTRVGENLPPRESEGWTVTRIERTSRYWITAVAGIKNEMLFERGVAHTWQWAEASECIRGFSDGERRSNEQRLWRYASLYLRWQEYLYRRHRKKG
jgi:hypothetical protein